MQPERIEDGPGAHLQAANKNRAVRHGKEGDQQNESADQRSHQAGKAHRAARCCPIQFHNSLRIRRAKAAEMSGLDGRRQQNHGQTQHRETARLFR